MPPNTQPIDYREFLNARVVGLRFDRVHFETKFTGSTFQSCEFIGCRLDRVLMQKTHWTDCQFDGSTLVVEFSDSVFERCSFRGAIFRGLSGEYGGVRARFVGCGFSTATLRSLKLRACKFEGCDFSDTQILNCDLRGATHNGTPLKNVG
jgi:uncharacterized protein YjbI with pentapeptide repeats